MIHAFEGYIEQLKKSYPDSEKGEHKANLIGKKHEKAKAVS